MKQFLKCVSIELGIHRVRIDIDTIGTYFEYDGTGIENDEEGVEFPSEPCVIIKTDSGLTFFVKESIETIDEIITAHNEQNRFGYMGGSDD